jgi:hypothetical protein
MSMSEETKARVKKTLGLCDEYFEAIQDSFDDNGHFVLDKNLTEPYKAKRSRRNHISRSKTMYNGE